MRLAIFLDSLDIVGGGQRNVIETVTRLVNDYRYEIDIYTRKIQNSDSQVNPSVNGLNSKLRIIRLGPETEFFNPIGRVLTIFTMLFSFLKENHKKRYDLINAHTYLGAVSGKLASLITKIPIILTVHGTNLTDINERSISAEIEKQICFKTKYNGVTAVGEGYKKYPNINKNVYVIPNGINLEVGANHDSPVQNKTGNVNSECLNLLFVGRFQKVKGFDVLLDAINLIKNENLLLNAIGYGYLEEEYKRKVKELGLQNKVIFLGKKTGNQLTEIYRHSDLLVVPSLSEGDGIVVKEAWANGIPVLVTRCNGPEYFVEDNMDGFIVEKNNPKVLAQKLKEIVYLPKEKLNAMGGKGYEKVKEKYQWVKIVERIDEIYKHLI